ncbi:two-component system, response regulator YesN [Bacillus sp. OV166]|uniref:response regulator n=1 Tax=Bacillus sp. OV166 TaxID=1882763 RepID=UPI000A2AC02B|nr:response regulator [Bacillus sp. OV166]SMQ63460.1 two-component system, response regulator YesN [Bacillus sp. OV166]
MTTIKTIIVDDEARIRRGIERLVRSCGEEWEVIGTFSDGQEAYEAMTTCDEVVDLVITDVQMPEMDGLTLVKELKKSHSFFALIISGFDDFKYLQTALREGAVNYILKPVEREQFRVQMQEVKEKIMNKRNELREWEKVQETALQLTYTKQVQLLSEVTWNADTDLSLLDWTRLFPKGNYQLVYISVDQILSKTKGFNTEEWETWNFAVENIMSELIINDFHVPGVQNWWWRSGKLNFWLLLLNEEQERETSFESITEHFVGQLRNAIQRHTPFTVSIALGGEFEELSLLLSYRDQLLSLIQFRMIQGGNKVFQLDLIKTISDENPKGITSSVYKHVEQTIHALERGAEEEIVKSLQEFFSEIAALSSPVLIEEAVQYLSIRIVNRWMEHDGFGEDPYVLTEAMQLTKHAANFTQLKDSVKHWVLNVMKNMRALTYDQSSPVQQAKEWIQNNLGESITIKKIANYVYMNPNYFCEYFKNQTGETVLDYVTRSRLEKAKELLGTTDLKIYDISCQIGYQDTKYFSRLFKQWMGQSPSQYREHYFKTYSIS